ncbi:phage tail protein [Elioraea sp.]|uniref:phage tail protein n=1 Tax=Elioraea sp. TaxID=2185103 RepID=UPI0025C420C3|nr:tail fiber protein [Elioraea sp.]
MATLPPNNDLTGSGVTQGGFRTALNAVLDVIRDTLGSTGTPGGARTTLGLGALATKSSLVISDLPANIPGTQLADGSIPASKLASGAAIPAGFIMDFAGATPPTGWLLCDGSPVSRTAQAALFAAIGTTWGAGDGSTTFNLPDLRGRVRAGRDNMGGTAAGRLTNTGTGNPGLNGQVLGGAGGSDRHTLGTPQIPSHTHTGTAASAGAHTHTVLGPYFDPTFGSTTTSGDNAGALSPTQPVTSSAGAHTHGLTIDAAGGGEAHPNVQPTAVVNSVIKT